MTEGAHLIDYNAFEHRVAKFLSLRVSAVHQDSLHNDIDQPIPESPQDGHCSLVRATSPGYTNPISELKNVERSGATRQGSDYSKVLHIVGHSQRRRTTRREAVINKTSQTVVLPTVPKVQHIVNQISLVHYESFLNSYQTLMVDPLIHAEEALRNLSELLLVPLDSTPFGQTGSLSENLDGFHSESAPHHKEGITLEEEVCKKAATLFKMVNEGQSRAQALENAQNDSRLTALERKWLTSSDRTLLCGDEDAHIRHVSLLLRALCKVQDMQDVSRALSLINSQAKKEDPYPLKSDGVGAPASIGDIDPLYQNGLEHLTHYLCWAIPYHISLHHLVPPVWDQPRIRHLNCSALLGPHDAVRIELPEHFIEAVQMLRRAGTRGNLKETFKSTWEMMYQRMIMVRELAIRNGYLMLQQHIADEFSNRGALAASVPKQWEVEAGVQDTLDTLQTGCSTLCWLVHSFVAEENLFQILLAESSPSDCCDEFLFGSIARQVQKELEATIAPLIEQLMVHVSQKKISIADTVLSHRSEKGQANIVDEWDPPLVLVLITPLVRFVLNLQHCAILIHTSLSAEGRGSIGKKITDILEWILPQFENLLEKCKFEVLHHAKSSDLSFAEDISDWTNETNPLERHALTWLLHFANHVIAPIMDLIPEESASCHNDCSMTSVNKDAKWCDITYEKFPLLLSLWKWQKDVTQSLFDQFIRNEAISAAPGAESKAQGTWMQFVYQINYLGVLQSALYRLCTNVPPPNVRDEAVTRIQVPYSPSSNSLTRNDGEITCLYRKVSKLMDNYLKRCIESLIQYATTQTYIAELNMMSPNRAPGLNADFAVRVLRKFTRFLTDAPSHPSPVALPVCFSHLASEGIRLLIQEGFHMGIAAAYRVAYANVVTHVAELEAEAASKPLEIEGVMHPDAVQRLLGV